MKWLSLFNINIKIDETDKEKQENAVFDQIIKQLSRNDDKFHNDYDKETDVFRVKKEDFELLGNNELYPRERLPHENIKEYVLFLGIINEIHWKDLRVKIKKEILYF